MIKVKCIKESVVSYAKLDEYYYVDIQETVVTIYDLNYDYLEWSGYNFFIEMFIIIAELREQRINEILNG